MKTSAVVCALGGALSARAALVNRHHNPLFARQQNDGFCELKIEVIQYNPDGSGGGGGSTPGLAPPYPGSPGCAASGSTVPVFIGAEYGNPSFSTSNTSCYGQIADSTFSNLPMYPNIGAFCGGGFFSPDYCGQCFELTYGANTVTVMAVDNKGSDGFLIPAQVCNRLTGGDRCERAGSINVQYTGPVPCPTAARRRVLH